MAAPSSPLGDPPNSIAASAAEQEAQVELHDLDGVTAEFGYEEDDDLICHCGEPVTYGYDGDPAHHRGMCAHCDPIRCDAYPGECHR